MGRVAAVLAIAAASALLTIASLFVTSAFSAPATPARTRTVVAIVDVRVDGKGVRWWAARARRNGDAMRRLQRANRDALAIAGGFGLTRAFLCIKSFEASWRNAGVDWTGRPSPYYGGLQMDLAFQRTYGGEFLQAWGTADKWPPFVQVAVAMRAYLSGRGFHPWPNSARRCGLL